MIAILAAISVVAYNGVQARAENAKTVAAASYWAKALLMHKGDNGGYPSTQSCLGSAATYTSSGGGRCWNSATDTTWSVQAGFLSAMSLYMSSQPEPSQVNVNTAASQRRGAIFYRPAAGDERIYTAMIGFDACPSISGLGSSIGSTNFVTGKECYYRLPQ